MNIDKNFFPGWVRKSVTFSIDDGNIPLDKKFMDVVKPYGICGTFNLSTLKLDKYTPEFYREFYRGYGISNHCRLHPFPMTEERRKPISNDKFNNETSDKEKLYETGTDGIYKIFNRAYWAYVAEPDAYMQLVDEGKVAIEEVFGKGSITTFVWPYSESANTEVLDRMINHPDYIAIRKTGATKDSDGFSFPKNRKRWSYNTGHTDLKEVSKLYDEYPDDGNLKFFCFGVHSHDYENNNCCR